MLAQSAADAVFEGEECARVATDLEQGSGQTDNVKIPPRSIGCWRHRAEEPPSSLGRSSSVLESRNVTSELQAHT